MSKHDKTRDRTSARPDAAATGSVYAIPMSRRVAIQCGLFGAAGYGLASPWAGPVQAAPDSAKAKAVIQIWMWGGPSHLDTFDPKPQAGNDYCGPLGKPIATSIPGTQICELLPSLAKQSDKYSIVRGMTHGINAHETASYIVQTGRQPGGKLVYPSVGAVVSLFKGERAGYEGLIPPYIVLTQPQGRFSEAGFLDARFKPFATGGDPARTPFAVEGVVAEGITEKRQRARRELLHRLNTLGQKMPKDAQFAALHQCEERAYDLVLGDAGKVFDLTTEKDAVREQYGRNTFGQACLVARRLIEKGVRYITINYKGWDTHKQNFQAMRRNLPNLDKGMATLLTDLESRGLLESTIVWWTGEFGRTPKIQWQPPWNGGRGHYGKAFSAVVAGGGFKGGSVIGATDAKGEEVVDRPVHPTDLIRSMYTLLGIDAQARLPHPQGLEIPVMPQPTEGAVHGGLLTEIM